MSEVGSVRAGSAPAARSGGAGQASYVRSFNRYELKYVVRQDAARAFLDGIAPFVRPDPRSGEHGYRVHSVYWDSPELVFFWEKIDGQKVRRKLRFRRYGDPQEDGAEPAIFVEIKQRIDRTVQKRRARLPVEEARSLFGTGHVDAAREAEVRDPAVLEALRLCRYHRLQPTMAVAYRRRAFLGVHEHDLRITVDTRLAYDARLLDPAGHLEPGKGLLDPRLAVVELKYGERVPQWLCRAVEHARLELVRLSKYCAAVDREHFGGRHS